MMKRVVWRPGRAVLIELPNNVYTVGQMLLDPYLQLFNFFADDAGEARASPLGNLEPLFCVAVVNAFLKEHCEALPQGGRQEAEVPTRWIRPLMRAGLGFRGGDLIEFDPRVGRNGSERPVIPDLNSVEHRDVIDAHELTNVRGGPEFAERLLMCRAYGRNVDPLKAKVFDFSYEL